MLPITRADAQTYDNAKVHKPAISASEPYGAVARLRRCLPRQRVGALLLLMLLVGTLWLGPFWRPAGGLNARVLERAHRPMRPRPADTAAVDVGVADVLVDDVLAGEVEAADDGGPDDGGQQAAPGGEGGYGEETVRTIWHDRRDRVIEAIRHAWKGYKQWAWGYDELQPLSRTGSTWFDLGLTIVDSLDTLWLAGLSAEFSEAREWVAEQLRLDNDREVNVFEVTIRVLGGLLSAHHLTQDGVFLDKARDLGDRLMGAFSSHTPIPYASVNLRTRTGIRAHFAGGASSTSEVTTLQLEFAYLSALTGDPKYGNAARAVMDHIERLPKYQGLVPIFISPDSGQFVGNELKLGARGDSYYEYLLKQFIQSGGTDTRARRMYDEAVSGIHAQLVHRSQPNDFTYIAEKMAGSSGINPKMDHLVCFLPGTLALGVTQGQRIDQVRDELDAATLAHWELAEELMATCYEMYRSTATGLAPEIVYFNTQGSGGSDLIIKPADRHNLLRPETVESLFVLYRLSGDVKYREWGWQIFEAFERHTRIPDGGYACLDDVTRVPPPKRDKMESFFLAETLKYLLLLFDDDDVLPLTDVVFNTEAHPFPILRG